MDVPSPAMYNLRAVKRVLAVVLGGVLLAGCARSPGLTPPGPRRQMIVTVALDAAINSAYNYFIAIDTNGNPDDGPVPLIMTPSIPMPVTRFPLIISDSDVPPAFVLWLSNGVFRQYRNQVFIGPPFTAQIAADRRSFSVTIDLDQVSTTASALDINFITADRLIPLDDPLAPIDTDGLGPTGNSYLAGLSILQSARYTNATSLIPEEPGDAPDPSLDIVDWTLEVRL